MQGLFLGIVFFSLMFMGASAPFAAALGFIWADVVKPQSLAYSVIRGWPLSLIAAGFTIGLFVIRDRKYPPKFGILLSLIALFCFWITVTTYMSTLPGPAWKKWDWAFKVLVFALIFPRLFRSRVQIEAFVLIFVFSAATIFFSAGIKSLAGSGGYGSLAVMGGSNAGLSEGSTLALICVTMVPLIMYCMQHNMVFPRNKFTIVMFLIVILTAMASVVGTTARTGIIATLVLCVRSILRSQRKRYWFAALAVGAIVVMNLDLSSTRWGSRMSTIETYNQDSSAMGRIMVWKWTIDFAMSHPAGGGFDAYMLNGFAKVLGDGEIVYYPDGEINGKAFHSIYFEVLGEQGIIGFVIYFSIVLISLFKLIKMRKKWHKEPEMAWLAALADSLTTSILIILAGGNFVGIAYQPYLWYMIGLTISLENYAARAEKNLQSRAIKGA